MNPPVATAGVARGRSWRRGRSRSLADIRRREEMAGARRLLLLRDALLLGIGAGRHARRWGAAIEDRPAEIAGQRRPELRRGLGQPGVVPGKIRQAVGRVAVVGVVEFGACGLMLRLRARRTARRRCRAPRPCPGRAALLRDRRVTGGRLDRSRISSAGRLPSVGPPSSRGASVTTAASRRCGRSARSADACRRA